MGLAVFLALVEAHSTGRDLRKRKLVGHSVQGLSLERHSATGLPNDECAMEHVYISNLIGQGVV